MARLWFWIAWTLAIMTAVVWWSERPVHAQENAGCSFEHGGELGACDHLVRSYPGAAEHPGVFTSGGVMALRNARCVHPQAVFRFHGAYYPRGPGYGDPNVLGSEHMRGALRRYPALVRYLDSTGVWMSGGGPTLDMTGEQLGQFGVPVCR